ncbi:MAG: ribonuclease HI [Bryobacteraceae bacterium]
MTASSASSPGNGARRKVTLVTDGACIGNPGPGGWACILRYGDKMREIFGFDPNTTNNRMEMMAAIQGLAALKSPCDVGAVTDSEYLLRGATRGLRLWKRRGWWRRLRRPLPNADLWVELDYYLGIHAVSWSWTRGHTGHPDNDRCDWLATTAAKNQTSSWDDRHPHAPMHFNYGRAWIPPHPQTGLFDLEPDGDVEEEDDSAE